MDNTTTDTAAFPDAIQDETLETQPPPPPDRETYDEPLDCVLSDEDKEEKRKRLETVDRELVRLDVEKKAAAKVFNNQIKPLAAERESILEALDSGTERRMVECYEFQVKDAAGNLVRVEVRRVDDDSVVEERAATEDEIRESAQGDLFSGGSSAPPPPDDDPVTPEDFEPTPEALAQAAEDEGRVVKTNSKEAKAKRKQREQANGSAE